MPKIPQNIFTPLASTASKMPALVFKCSYGLSKSTPFKTLMMHSLSQPLDDGDKKSKLILFRGMYADALKDAREKGISPPHFEGEKPVALNKSAEYRRPEFRQVVHHVESGYGKEFLSFTTDRKVAARFASQREVFMGFGSRESCTGMVAMVLVDKEKATDTLEEYKKNNVSHPYTNEKEFMLHSIAPNEVLALCAIGKDGKAIDPKLYDIEYESDVLRDQGDFIFKPKK